MTRSLFALEVNEPVVESPEYDVRQGYVERPVPPEHIVDAILNPAVPASPFAKVIGQEKAKRRLGRMVRPSLLRPDRLFTDNLLVIGSSSVGKTYLCRVLVNDILTLPLIELDGATVKNKAEILYAVGQKLLDIDQQWRANGGGENDPLGLTLLEYPGNRFYLPPCVIMIDEAHKMPKALQMGILKATEQNDRVMATENGFTVDCSRVGWILATTDRGDLIEPLDTRFTKVQLNLYSREEIAQIVKLSFPRWHINLCNLIAYYAPRVPREALEFAREVDREKQQRPNLDWNQAAANCAEDAGIDRFGMTYQRLSILTVLGQRGPVSKGRCCLIAQCKEAELASYIMPALLTQTPGEPALVTTCSRGYAITPAGLQELDRRGIQHLGKRALPKDFIPPNEGDTHE